MLLDGTSLHADNNNNVAYFNSPKYNKLMETASRLSGSARTAAYGKLDVDMMQNAAPWAATHNSNSRILVSKHFGCFTYNSIYQADLAAACVK